ncbi:N-acetylmuramoyl-L-alanine amidase [Lyngbya confervoides]|uniref:N-acetylmuramoyl-L-alanine amidase n=1 Tax=Lyngbya confervoides BDU141951 TaxID=1574623 RepID=A0ABD4SZM5_9CYAN|nr:N-acetylmuramoyl-L-alanine amidase [Lyngbya confervoides]MCM1981507.1 N-acetylmuramoyl-L-alanine amidase [Lyngbya confervoides BDU141951]
MKKVVPSALFTLTALTSLPAYANDALQVVYPPADHQTAADRIFIIGTAPPDSPVRLNGTVIQDRSVSGHFAPSIPLAVGENVVTLDAQGQQLTLRITRSPSDPPLPSQFGFLDNSLQPAVDLARMPHEPICFRAIATPNSQVLVTVGSQQIKLLPVGESVELPPNSAVLTLNNQPQPQRANGVYQNCTGFADPGFLGSPQFQVTRATGDRVAQVSDGSITILDPANIEMVEVTASQGVARTGPSTNHSRLTPLPQGTQARITGAEGDWWRLDYGAWIKKAETQTIPRQGPTQSIIRSLKSRSAGDWTEVVFPLQTPVPISVEQGDRFLRLTLHNTTAQTDTIFVPPDAVIERLDWSQPSPQQATYRFQLKAEQAWGYKLRYEGTSLILSLRHPPQLSRDRRSLQGAKILLDAGHGSENDLGARGPNGYPEKDANLFVTQVLQRELENRGAEVIMTRLAEEDLYPQDRVAVIEQREPHLAVSLHFNALPDNGDALKTQGIGAFWYHPQAYDFSVFIHDYLVNRLGRKSYGVFWNNLALTRPTVSPSVLLELGFMINPEEFEWISDSKAQTQLGKALADGITLWFHRSQTGERAQP